MSHDRKGCVWWLGACMVGDMCGDMGGMHGGRGACVVAGGFGHAWWWGGGINVGGGGMCGDGGGHVWLHGGHAWCHGGMRAWWREGGA